MKRHKDILEKLEKEKHLEVSDLCEHLGVSAVTIRKDLKFLETKGLLHRTHGGASLDNPYINERTVIDKAKVCVEQKTSIAKMAASRILENDSILIASGTTVQIFSKHITAKTKLTVITSSIYVALNLIDNTDIEIIQLGGYLRHSSASVIGKYAELILKDISCSTLFLGVDGIDLDYGLSTTNIEEAALNKKMMKSAQKVIVLADSSKFGKKSFARIADLSEVHEIITDRGISSLIKKKLEEKEIKVTIID
ncbi:DeoR/GlpR transcriptional regulator [Subsaximicrobium wynnwilliamsii]|uniref:DeoR/GlpR transcriptional regulator n=1 Tax=Subsaximicrobium wynnwilliamsii TaxID=291179 RepID=A0A5C6ZLS8_9FLAO|nr:DeoR/GlpR family DNA-binding transcription regulator [Subsaximicrobium wynnwilliamsii]TXD85215.1 DeoR/GlpR transcriptional regulator [Subsaximicrobium wynnwilliamsii]TXD91258.1 DeoR/GlpR transcriptional regulator [Subsaximicrobium wynnwilliamsii]TXE04651.1 DeoR/GlpR transcriptional regulator [Subsaximicrobium wynnwilliamsii]